MLDRSSFQTLLTEVQDNIVEEMGRRETTGKDAAPAGGDAPVGPLTSIPFEDLKVMRTVGTGTFGRVKMVQVAGTGQVRVAMCFYLCCVICHECKVVFFSYSHYLYVFLLGVYV